MQNKKTNGISAISLRQNHNLKTIYQQPIHASYNHTDLHDQTIRSTILNAEQTINEFKTTRFTKPPNLNHIKIQTAPCQIPQVRTQIN